MAAEGLPNMSSKVFAELVHYVQTNVSIVRSLFSSFGKRCLHWSMALSLFPMGNATIPKPTSEVAFRRFVGPYGAIQTISWFSIVSVGFQLIPLLLGDCQDVVV